ncbi:UNVERIFIED_CONTAM: hypothetical protein Cloal_0425 [Acetivibrio alkalicellulosi]
MNSKKRSIIITIFVVMAIQIIVVNAVGINLTHLLKTKTDSLVTSSTQDIDNILKQARQETLDETSLYIDNYIKGIEQELDEYAALETESAKLKIKDKTQEIKNALEAQRQGNVNQGKNKIKKDINDVLDDHLAELDNQLSILLQQKLGN